MTENVQLICPNCETHNLFQITRGQSQVECPKCKRRFVSWIVRIRAKNSRQDKRADTRAYSVRVIDVNGGEHLVEFQQRGIANFELRSGDLAAFSYVNNNLMMIQNLTIGRYLSLKSGCSTLTWVAVAVLILLVLICALGGVFKTIVS